MVELTLKVKPAVIEKRKKQAKVARYSRARGKRGEHNVALLFSNWFGEPESFLPSSSSGAGNRFGQAGDFSVPRNFKFVIENKNQEAWLFEHILGSTVRQRVTKGKRGKPDILTNTTNIFWDYWLQAMAATKDYNEVAFKHNLKIKFPMLTFTKNNECVFVMIQDGTDGVVVPKNFFTVTNVTYGEFIICVLNDFLEINTIDNLFWSNPK